MESDESNNNRFLYILNIPNLRQQILQYLSIRTLIRLSGVSRTIKLLIDEIYLPYEVPFITDIEDSLSKARIPNQRSQIAYRINLYILLAQTVHSLRALKIRYVPYLTDERLIDILNSNLNLKYLSLNFCNHLSQTALHSIIVHGRNLKVLHLIGYKIDSYVEIEFDEIKWEELGISCMYFDKYDDSNIYLARLLQKCKHLRALTLYLKTCHSNTVIISDLGKVLENCKNLKKLHIINYKDWPMGKTYEIFSYLPNLKYIENFAVVESNDIYDNSLKIISKLKNLKQLVLDDCNAIEKGLGYLTSCENLQILSLNRNQWVTDDVLKIITNFRNLRRLHLVDCYEVTPDGISNLAKGCPTLETVFLRSGEDHGRECYRILKVVVHVIEPPDRHSCITHGEYFRIAGYYIWTTAFISPLNRPVVNL